MHLAALVSGFFIGKSQLLLALALLLVAYLIKIWRDHEN